MRARPLADRSLSEPHSDRLRHDHSRRTEILARHDAALASGESGYEDPETGYHVFTAGFLARRGTCCDQGCRHCPYVV